MAPKTGAAKTSDAAAAGAGNALSKAHQKLQQRHQQLRSRCADLESQVSKERERGVVCDECFCGIISLMVLISCTWYVKSVEIVSNIIHFFS